MRSDPDPSIPAAPRGDSAGEEPAPRPAGDEPSGGAAPDTAAETAAAPDTAAETAPEAVTPAAKHADEHDGGEHREGAARPPPLLASEALMDDLAPMEPARGAARVWCAGVGLAYIGLGGLSMAQLRPGGSQAATASFLLGAVLLVAALTRVPYRQRAVAMVVLGVIATILGLRGSGPSVGMALGGPGWGAARAIAAAALPAALVFRSRYRAYAGARWLLLAAFVTALPFFGYAIARIAFLDAGLAQIGAGIVVVAIAASLSGFMGSETTGAGLYHAVAIALALSADLALGTLARMHFVTVRGATSTTAAAVSFAATSAIVCIGLFQILAFRLAPEARRIDLHRPTEITERRQSSTDWLS